MRRSLEQVARCVAEELGDVDTLDLPSGGSNASGRRRVVEEVGEEVVEEAATAEAARHPVVGEIELAEVFRFLRPVGAKAHSGRNCRPPVTLAKVLDGHLNLPLLGQYARRRPAVSAPPPHFDLISIFWR